MKFKLTNGVINVLVEQTLSTNNNVLSRAYIEKVAASLVREGITTALDAMNYLRDINKKAIWHSSKSVKQFFILVIFDFFIDFTT